MMMTDKIESLSLELGKIEEKLVEFDNACHSTLNGLLTRLDIMKEAFSKCDQLSEDHHNMMVSCAADVKSHLGNVGKLHRSVHLPLSKYGKLIDKTFDGILDSRLDDLRELSNLMRRIEGGDVDYARSWLSANRSKAQPGQVEELEYALVRIEFLSAMHQQPVNSTALLKAAQRLAPYAANYPEDFEHLMGSLLFVGRSSLQGTPYADLSPLSTTDATLLVNNPTNQPPSSSQQANNRAAVLLKRLYCRQSGLTEHDPLYLLFNSGCRTLFRLHLLQRAISRLTKFSMQDQSMLPVAADLIDPLAHRHNIFHCPVIKEVSSGSNRPVRLTCGHAISRQAFETLLGANSMVAKCPYCPIETERNRAIDLIF